MNRRRALPLLALLLAVSVGCLGASGGPTSTTPEDGLGATTDETPTATTGETPTATTDEAPTATTTETPTETTTGLDCPDDLAPFREMAVSHVADETGADPANVRVAKEAMVDYPILGECYYHAKVRDAEADRTHGVYVAENGTVVDREAVEARADRAYERRYGNLSEDLYERLQSADAEETLAVEVSIEDVNSSAVRQAVDREGLNDTEYKRALSAEYQRRAERKTEAVVAELREIEGVSVVQVGTLRARVEATPEATEEMQSLDRVVWLDLLRETTTYLD